MARDFLFFFDPGKNFRIGMTILGIGAALSGACAVFLLCGSIPAGTSLKNKKQRLDQTIPLSFSLNLVQEPLKLPIPSIEEEVIFSLKKSRPTLHIEEPLPSFSCQIRLKKTGQEKQVFLPARIDLKYENGLQFAPSSSSFWIELQELNANQIFVHTFISDSKNEAALVKSSICQLQENFIQSPLEIPKESPFKFFTETRFLGRDLFLEKYGNKLPLHRMEMGNLPKSQRIELKEADLLGLLEGQWSKIGLPPQNANDNLVQVFSLDDKNIVFDAWASSQHFRFSIPLATPSPLKTKTEDLLTSVRIRSEKQISCMLEKQCLVLKTGDWVFKGENRWKILRKKEEKDAYLDGKWVGELFVFDQIITKAGQKVIQGYLFNTDRSQIIPIEAGTAQMGKNPQGKAPLGLRQGKGK